ncbi:MAG: RNA polymerase sigma factor [Phycisphaerales bacterium]|nr:RNA polymerase sigma factor [Phycisphaerales bacterium]
MSAERPESMNPGVEPRPLSGEEFAAHFTRSFRSAWLLAVSILGDRTLADDVVQEAALIAWRRIDQYRRGTNFTAWLAQIVRFESLNHRRRAEHRLSTSVDPLEMDHALPGGAVVDPAPVIDSAGRLLLRVVEGLEYREIASSLGIPEGTAMSHVHRTRSTLRERLSGRQTPPDAAPDERSGSHAP